MADTRTCKRCGVGKPLEDFYKSYTTKQNTEYIFRRCKECINQAYRQRYKETYPTKTRELKTADEMHRVKKNKLQAIEYKGGKCFDCLETFHPSVYDFHHIDPSEKEVSTTGLMCKSWEKIKNEIEKCVLLCANCHRLRHFS